MKRNFITLIVYCAALVIILLAMCSCKGEERVIREVHTEYIHQTDTLSRVDSVLVDNSTVIREVDSTEAAEYGVRLKEKDKAILILQKQLQQEKSKEREVVHDTINHTDSVPKIVTVERELSLIEKSKMKLGDLTIFCMVGLLAFIIVKNVVFKK